MYIVGSHCKLLVLINKIDGLHMDCWILVVHEYADTVSLSGKCVQAIAVMYEGAFCKFYCEL